MTTLILIAVVIAVGLYLAPSETKGFLRWSKDGSVGIIKDAKAIRAKALEQAIEDPESTKKTHQWLNTTIADTEVYHREASLRYMEAAASLKRAQEKALSEAEQSLGV